MPDRRRPTLVRLGIAAVVAILALPVAIRGSQHLDLQPRVLVERSAYLMGTRVRLIAWDATRGEGLARLEEAVGSLEQTEAELSTWRSDSAISALNRSPIGTAWSTGVDLCRVFGVLSEWQASSGGAAHNRRTGGHTPMSFIVAIIIGGIIGWLASLIMKTNAQMGLLANIIVGIVGSVLGHWAAGALGIAAFGSLGSFIISLLGAVLLIVILRAVGVFK